MGKLTDRGIKALKGDGRWGDGGNLYIAKQGNSLTWSFRFTINAKAREMSLGPYPVIPLAQARELALEARRLLFAGVDPIDHRKAAKGATGRTFEAVAREYVEAHRAGWRNAKHAAQWMATVEAYALPVIGSKPVAAINTDHVLAILRPIWEAKAETASRVRGRIEMALDYAKSRGWRAGENPARWRGHLDKLLPARSKVAAVVHHPAIPWREMPGVYARLIGNTSMASQCLALVIMTASRSGEARGARWDEIDLNACTWTIPGTRMKAGKPHRVPLSDAAMAILDALKPHQRGTDGLVFPGGVVGKPLSDVGLSKALRVAAGEGFTVHGCRSTFREWCAEQTAYAAEIAEAALAHTNRDKVEAAYQRSDLIERRAMLMQDWADYLARPVAIGVVPIRGARA